MSDLNQLAQEKDALVKEINEISKEANSQIETIKGEAEEKIKPKNERITAIVQEIMDEVDAQAGIVKE